MNAGQKRIRDALANGTTYSKFDSDLDREIFHWRAIDPNTNPNWQYAVVDVDGTHYGVTRFRPPHRQKQDRQNGRYFL